MRPRCAAISLVVRGAVVCPTGLLRRRVKADVADMWWSQSQIHMQLEKLNSAVEVFVVNRVLVVPHTLAWIGYLVTHEPDAVVCRIGLILVHCRACPCHDGRLRPHSGSDRRKCVVVPAAADSESAIGSVVIHVALIRMRLAPRVFMRSDVLGFGKISRARVLRRI